ncbi:MAG: hypothetical protein ACXVBX_10785 [Flavisolibacter sp.]
MLLLIEISGTEDFIVTAIILAFRGVTTWASLVGLQNDTRVTWINTE